MTPEEREEYIRRTVWDAMLDADLNVRYRDHLSRRYFNLDKYAKIFLAVMSSSTVASWGIWSEIDILWKILSAISTLIAVVLPILNWQQITGRMFNLVGKWSQIRYEYENLWLDLLQNSKSINIIEDEYKRIKGAEIGLDETGLPDDRKLLLLCRDEVLKSRGLKN